MGPRGAADQLGDAEKVYPISEQDKVHRTVLPIPHQRHVGLTTYDAKDPDTKYPPIRELRPPKGAPNVLIVLIDDVGFGVSSAFGGPRQTPNFEKLAANGLRYNRFHTTALCSPTRQALLTGRNHHSGLEAYNHYAVGWAHSMSTPYQWTKQVASHFGGTRNGTIVHWPSGITAKNEVRSQFHRVIDIAPTILEVAGLPAPIFVNGVQQQPIEGVSVLYSFNDATAAERRETQYFEMMGNRGIYRKGWTAMTKHRTPWETDQVKPPSFDDAVWELYYTATDWSQSKDLARENPKKLHELQRLWLIEAVKYNVVPLDDRAAERTHPEFAGRPKLIKGNRQVLFRGMERLTESSVVNTKNKSHALTAEVVVPATGAQGVIVALRGIIGGCILYVRDAS